MIDELRNLNLERTTDVEELLGLAAFGKGVVEEYKEIGLPAPEWLTDRLNQIKTEVNTRIADIKAKRKKELQNQLKALQTREERRQQIEKELAVLE